jgi:hypothetical protein
VRRAKGAWSITGSIFFGQEGHIKSFVALNCREDGGAIEEAQQLLDGQDIELWSGDRKVENWTATCPDGLSPDFSISLSRR